ncbi:MAG TPA: cytochrome C oxidase subunit IV family protein [Vicinamibacteria bacterium]|nr:cytochrome C oxidase subunit IV family protein [Vicinamibacteria bacterium]
MKPVAARRQAAAVEHEVHVVSTSIYLAIFAALMVLTAITVWAARQDFGPFNTVVALGIAVVKATLVVLFFMHVKYSSGLTKLVVASAFVWLAIMIVGTLHDYYSPAVNAPTHLPTITRE